MSLEPGYDSSSPRSPLYGDRQGTCQDQCIGVGVASGRTIFDTPYQIS